jgi:hypothetical protein
MLEFAAARGIAPYFAKTTILSAQLRISPGYRWKEWRRCAEIGRVLSGQRDLFDVRKAGLK